MARERQGIGYHSLGANFKKITIEISRFEVCKKCFHLVCWQLLKKGSKWDKCELYHLVKVICFVIVGRRWQYQIHIMMNFENN